MNNNTCPICGEKTEGKAVRRVNFCKTHRALALLVRDHEEIKKLEARNGEPFWEEGFVQLICNFVRDANAILQPQNLKVVGT